jgi:hypothetical protein
MNTKNAKFGEIAEDFANRHLFDVTQSLLINQNEFVFSRGFAKLFSATPSEKDF